MWWWPQKNLSIIISKIKGTLVNLRSFLRGENFLDEKDCGGVSAQKRKEMREPHPDVS